MKKIFYSLICTVVALAACTPNGNNGPVIINPGDILVNRNEILDDETQKEKLEQVAGKMLTVFKAREFRDLTDMTEAFCSHAEKYYSDPDYDWSDLEDAGEDIWEDLYDERQRSDYKWEYTYTLFLSNCTGIVTFKKDEVTFKRSNLTMVIFEDVDGAKWEATLVAKDLKEVYLGEWIDAYYDGYNTYESVSDVTVEIPNSLTFEVTRDGEYFAGVTAKFNYSISEDGIDYEKDSFSVSLEVKIDDLVAKFDKLSANAATGKFDYSMSLVKDGMFVASYKISSTMAYEVDVEDGYIVDGEIDDAALAVECNILGELQIKGKCSDMQKLVKILNKSYRTQKQGESAAENATELVDLKVYYDGTSTVQARLEFEPIAYADSYTGSESFWIEPVIVFEDESRYLFYEYFEADDFTDLIEDFEDFLLDYKDMVEEIY